MTTAALVTCATCANRTLPHIAATWPGSRCGPCRDPRLREELAATIRRAREAFAQMDRERER